MASDSGRRVVVTGTTGRIGSALVAALRERGDAVVALSRDADRARERLGAGVEVHAWREPVDERPLRDTLAGAYAVVHLLGEPVDQRWTGVAKRAIRESRIASTRNLVAALRALPPTDAPAVLVSQSATGYYGARDGRPLDEHSPLGSGFLAEVVDDWERAAREAASCMRVGPVNVAAPQAVTNRELSHMLGRVLRRPALLPVPALALRAVYGDMASIVVTGQHVVPRRLHELGYAFRHPHLERALRDVLDTA